MEKYRIPFIADGEYFSHNQNINNIFKQLIFVVNDGRKDIFIIIFLAGIVMQKFNDLEILRKLKHPIKIC